MRKHLIAIVVAGAIGLAVAATAAQAEILSGAGGTAIYPVLAEWADSYAEKSGVEVNYQAIGSGGGIRQIEAQTVLFGNTDMPLKPEDVEKKNLLQFPQLIISITPVVNLKGVRPGELVFDGPTLANIFLGKIKEWDDSAIKTLNPEVNLPHQAITTVHRADGSGTTFNFTNYLSKVSPEWMKKVGANTSVQWPGGVGGKGNAGVASFVQQGDGSIGYVEYAYVIQNNLTYVDMINKDGARVAPNMAAFQAAAAKADFSKVKDFYLILTDQPGAKSWPITAATYMLLRKDAPADKNHKVLKFLDWSLKDGQAQAEKLDYVPLPPEVIKQIEAYWHKEMPEAWWTKAAAK